MGDVDEYYAYLLGAIRDACVYIPEHELKFVQKDARWLTDVIKPVMQHVFGFSKIRVRMRRDGLFELKVNSKRMVEKLIEDAHVDNRPMDTPPIIERAPLSQQLWYIAGFYDAEGDKKGHRIRFWQSWYEVNRCPPLEFIATVLADVGVNTRLYKLGRRKSRLFEFCLEVSRAAHKNIILFYSTVPLQHPSQVLRAPREFRRA
uniref:Homing endonuclease LAGLIDADG domain-containing protein n=1 Tax=Caldiarchaeum subterraneum TaxID=311458 RepID=A0A7C4E082_CALS0